MKERKDRIKVTESNRLEIDNKFRLHTLIVKDDDSYIYNVNFMREEIEDDYSSPFTTLLLGSNGTGKSSILQMITEIFYYVESQISEKETRHIFSRFKYSYYELVYLLNNQLIKIEIKHKSIKMFSNSNELHKDDYMAFLPNKVLALAFMLNDKFVYSSSNHKKMYEYLGIRGTSNAGFINYMPTRIIENFVYLEKNGMLSNLLKELSTLFGQDVSFSISYICRYKNIDIKDIRLSLFERIDRLRTSRAYRSNAIERLTKDDIEDCVKFIEKTYGMMVGEKGRELEFTFGDDTIDFFVNNYSTIQNLYTLRLIERETLNIKQKNSRYSFEDASSGQKNMIYVISMIARYLQNDSLILIDEPEISLHPNWQMAYVSFIKKIFANYKSSHFVIATHSPYLVSDLEMNSSSIVTLKRENEKIISNTLEKDTYAWSVENILYDVFEVRTTRNYYFELDLRRLISLISENNKNDLKEIDRLYDKLAGYVFNENDPLNKILEQVEKVRKGVKSK